SIYVVANCSDAETGLSNVYLDASNIGGATQVPMVDDGSGNDYRAFDGLYTSKNVTLATGLVSGVYTYKVNAYDKSGNVGSQAGNIDIYNDVDITMANLLEGDVISGNYQLIANITDPDGIPVSSTNPRYRVDLNPWYNMSLLSGTNYAAILNTTQYLDGAHSLYVNAKDTYGAESTIETKFTIDNTPPSLVSVITPIPDEYIEGVYSFKVTAIDAIGIRNVTLTILNDTGYKQINNGTMGYNSGTGYYEYVLGTAALSDGKYNLSVVARDFAGFVTVSKNMTINIDNNEPAMTLNHPKNGNFVYGTVTMNISVNDTFLDKVEYNVDNSGWVNYTLPWNTTMIDDGSHTVQIRAKDLAGHEVLVTIYVTVDNNFPICVLSKPGQERYIEGIYVLRSYAFDEVGINSVRLTINHVVDINATNQSITEVLNTSMGYNTGTGYYEFIFDTTGLPDGNYTINVTAKDTAGNATYTGNITFYIDNNAPEVMLNDPYEGRIVSGNVDFDISIINESFLDWIRYNIDGAGWIDWATPWDTTQIKDGAHTVDIRIHDRAGHNTDLNIQVFVDNKYPLCNIVSPVANQYIEGLYTFKVAASDQVEIENVTLFVFGNISNTTYNTQTSSYEYSVDTTVYDDGSYYLTARAYDTSGKSVQSIPIPFHVDNHAPILDLNSPTEGQYVYGIVNFDVTVTDFFKDKVEYNIDGKGWVPTYTPWNTTGLKDDKHTVQVRATDKFGHETEQTINLIVDNHDPVCIIHAPIENQYIEDTFTFKIVALDAVGIDYVELQVFYRIINAPYNSNTGYYEFTIDTSNFEDGKYNVTAICRDLASRTNITAPLDFRVDNEYPVLQVKAPLNGVFVEGEVEIDLVISDAFPSVTQYNIDGNGWIPYQINPFWNSTTVLYGEHE
ncbi:MAG: hypothetical protein KAJ51_14870, partial [Thermoplasmata archaeon]|nr:hypothetical protein [Thermoplasmata archaeon]